MKKSFRRLMVSLVMALILALPMQVGAKGLEVREGNTLTVTGTQFSITLLLKNAGSDFATLGFDFQYDKSLMNLVSYDFIAPFSNAQAGGTVYNERDLGNGFVNVSAGVVNVTNSIRPLDLDDGEAFCTLTFQFRGTAAANTTVSVGGVSIVRVSMVGEFVQTLTDRDFNSCDILIQKQASGGGTNPGDGDQGGNGGDQGGGDQGGGNQGGGNQGGGNQGGTGGTGGTGTGGTGTGGTETGGTGTGGTGAGGNNNSDDDLIDMENEEVALGLVTINAGNGTLKFMRNGVKFIDGRPNNTFGPDEPIMRGDVCVMIFNACEKTVFSDIDKGAYYTEAVISLTAHKVLSGYPDGTFRPANNMTIAEAASILTYFIDVSEPITGTHIDGIKGHWCEAKLNRLAYYGVFDGRESLDPNALITRAELVCMINRVIGVDLDTATMRAMDFDDVPPTHPAYRDIMAAAR